ncbi:hypothetical protein EXE59_06700 [Nocardioides eburneiflavus]|uniref:Uncharacterized protein n=1 Tax=Nocardioides eburneiflavus TaxID=2518372 RepID=A0A4Z1CJ66_9ACTN|nr:hypothetical protein [Nocardioides eburneiflavus]TGN63673.1 hypothetical protein EXE59_06700 [Nocardioides eburneiflavus]
MTTAAGQPFSVAWTSDSLYREASGPDPFLGPEGDLTPVVDEMSGTRVEVDGWDDALDAAWQDIVRSDEAAVREWERSYVAARGAQDLAVDFNDGTRVSGRAGAGYYGVSYPAGLLLADAGGKVAAMRTAVLVVLDRHVDRQSLDVPLLSDVYAGA